MTQSGKTEKVIQINTEANAVSDILKCDNYLMIGTKDSGLTLSYAYDIREDLSWLEMALFLGYIELVKDRIMCKGGCDVE